MELISEVVKAGEDGIEIFCLEVFLCFFFIIIVRIVRVRFRVECPVFVATTIVSNAIFIDIPAV